MTPKPRLRSRRKERALAITEFAVLIPLLLMLFVSVVDISRIIYMRQALADLTRETGSLISRGTPIEVALNQVVRTGFVFDLDESGSVIISRVRRRNEDDATPWVHEQTFSGFLAGEVSRVGQLDSEASIPGFETLPEGVTLSAVELAFAFEPLFPINNFGINIFPEIIYQSAFF
jgi:hypothetical protein